MSYCRCGKDGWVFDFTYNCAPRSIGKTAKYQLNYSWGGEDRSDPDRHKLRARPGNAKQDICEGFGDVDAFDAFRLLMFFKIS